MIIIMKSEPCIHRLSIEKSSQTVQQPGILNAQIFDIENAIIGNNNNTQCDHPSLNSH
jgi:hypothetical protein